MGELHGVKRLLYDTYRTEFEQLSPFGGLRLGGEKHHGYMTRGIGSAQTHKRFGPVDIGHHHVEKNGVRLFVFGHCNTFDATTRDKYFPTRNGFQAHLSNLSNVVVVFDE
jgi:hypothetical protein